VFRQSKGSSTVMNSLHEFSLIRIALFLYIDDFYETKLLGDITLYLGESNTILIV